MTKPAFIESSQARADRLLAEHQAMRNVEPGHFVVIEAEPSRWDRIRERLHPWVVGFDNPWMDALGVAFALYFVALLTAFAAMCWADHSAPPASHAPIAQMEEATPRPATTAPLGGGAFGETI